MLAMATSFKCLNFKQEWPLRIMIRAFHHSQTYWDEMIETLNILRSISKIHARTSYYFLVDTQDSNEMLPQKVEVDPLMQNKKIQHSKASFQILLNLD